MGNRIQIYKTFYSIPRVESGIASWNTFAEIKKWGKTHGYDSFIKNKRLFLVKEDNIIVYVMIPKEVKIEEAGEDVFGRDGEE